MTSIKHWITSIEHAARELDSEKVKIHAAQLVKTIESREEVVPERFCIELQSALDNFDEVKTNTLCEQLITFLHSDDCEHWLNSVHTILSLLQRKRKFDWILKIAELVFHSGEYQPKIKRLYAQALIEKKYLTAAIDVLTQLEGHCVDTEHSHEVSESRGLLGRAWKQIYMDAAATGYIGSRQRKALENAIGYYFHEFTQNPKERLWHGINAIALSHRAKRDGVDLPESAGDSVLASILDSIEKCNNTAEQSKGNPVQKFDMWTQATAAEAYLAKGNFTEAVRWLVGYVDNEHVREKRSDAFEVASTLRQFEEVWQLSDDKPAESQILEILRAALLSREGGVVSITDPVAESVAIAEILADSAFEKVLGKDRYKNLQWYQTGLNRARCVCRIEDTFGDGFGTGFLMHSSTLGLSYADEWVVLTNAHVVSGDASEQQARPAALAPENAQIRFEAGHLPDRVFPIARILASSPRNELDFSILAIDGFEDIAEPYRIEKQLPRVDQNQRIYIIGHPKGGGLSFSLHDNLLLDHEIPKLHYRSPTEGGSSGSPVFNQNWNLIGLHHAGGSKMPRLNGEAGFYAANEGISMHSIISAIAKN